MASLLSLLLLPSARLLDSRSAALTRPTRTLELVSLELLVRPSSFPSTLIWQLTVFFACCSLWRVRPSSALNHPLHIHLFSTSG